MISIDRALRLIESGKTDDLSEHAAALVTSILPLLEFAGRTLDPGLESISGELRERIAREFKSRKSVSN